MDKGDVAAISLQKSFNKKWWDSKRSFKARGSGTGEALAQWQKLCPDNVETLADPDDLNKAEAMCETLRKTLKVAQGKDGDAQMVAAIKKMMKLIDEYEVSLLNLKKEQTNKYVALGGRLQDVINLAREFKQKLPPFGTTVQNARKQLPILQEQADDTEQLGEQQKNLLLKEVNEYVSSCDDVEKQMAKMTLAMKNAESGVRNDIFAASKDAKFRPTLEKYRTGTAAFDEQFNEIYDDIQDLRARFQKVAKLVKEGESIESALEDLDKMITIMGGAQVGHFHETIEIMKERSPKIAEWSKDLKVMTPRNWQDAALWEDDAKGAMDKAPTTNRMLTSLMTDMQRYNKKFGQNQLAKSRLGEAARLYQTASKDRDLMLKLTPLYRKQLQALLEKNHA